MAGAKLSQEEVSKAVYTIFREAGIEDQDCLTLKDFQYVMLKEHRDSFAKAQLSLPGIRQRNFYIAILTAYIGDGVSNPQIFHW